MIIFGKYLEDEGLVEIGYSLEEPCSEFSPEEEKILENNHWKRLVTQFTGVHYCYTSDCRRYFILNKLMYDHDNAPAGSIMVGCCRIESSSHVKKRFAFWLTPSGFIDFVLNNDWSDNRRRISRI